MPRPKILINFDATPGLDVETEFKKYGGTDQGWAWIVRELYAMDARFLERRLRKLETNPPTCRMVHKPYVVWGRLDLVERKLWEEGVVDGTLVVEAIVHRDHEREYYADRRGKVPKKEQDV